MSVADTEIVWSDSEIRTSRLGTVLDHNAEADITRLVELAEPSKKDIAMDIITGLGHVARALAPRVTRVDAVDPDGELLKESESITPREKFSNINFIEGNPLALQFESDSYDIVTARMAMRHLGNGVKFIQETHRVLKPGGRLMLVDSLAPFQADLAGFMQNLLNMNDRSHIQTYNLAEIENLLERENYDIDLIEIYPKDHAFETWAAKLGEDKDSARMIAMMLKSASDRAKRHFRIIEKGKKIKSFVTWMILVRARPAPITGS